jgi:hypothetical protein
MGRRVNRAGRVWWAGWEKEGGGVWGLGFLFFFQILFKQIFKPFKSNPFTPFHNFFINYFKDFLKPHNNKTHAFQK